MLRGVFGVSFRLSVSVHSSPRASFPDALVSPPPSFHGRVSFQMLALLEPFPGAGRWSLWRHPLHLAACHLAIAGRPGAYEKLRRTFNAFKRPGMVRPIFADVCVFDVGCWMLDFRKRLFALCLAWFFRCARVPFRRHTHKSL